MSKQIDITNELDYVSLDDAIEKLKALRETHGGKSIIDVSVETAPYENHAHAEVNLLIKDKS